MELVFDEAGHVKVVEGKPLYKHSDGREIPFDAAGTVATINRLNGEAKSHRLKAEEFEGKLKVFDGLDPEAARKALETVKNFDDKKLIDAGEVEKVRESARQAYDERLAAVTAQIDPLKKEVETYKTSLNAERVGNAFGRSKFIEDKLAIPVDIAQTFFGKHFRAEEDGSILGYDHTGNKILSRARPGEIATFDEALELLVEAYPNRDRILKGSGASGSGAPGSNGANVLGKSLNRAAFNNLSPTDQMKHIKAGGKVSD